MMPRILEPYLESSAGAPAHWRAAAMPDADWHVASGERLVPVDGAAALEAGAELLAQMHAAVPGATLLARERDAVWRLRRAATSEPISLWAAQALDDSRMRVFQQLRQRLGERLAPQVLHELRNPMNALSLHTDLLGRLIAMPEAVERAGSSARVIRERQRDLAARHDALVALWFAVPSEGGESGMAAVAAAALRMARNYGTLREVRIHADAFDALDDGPAPRRAAHVELVLTAALLLACDDLAGSARQELRIEWRPAAVPTLRIHPAPAADADAGGFEWGGRRSSNAQVVATLALLLDDEPLSLSLHDGELQLRFDAARRPPAVR